MTFGGVPIFDWVILVVLIGFGIEAYVTTRDKGDDKKGSDHDAADPAAAEPATRTQTQEKSKP